jgi:catechol 2,3-dioxygenase-like lactoylglutathione lyase family enzyme
MTGLSRRSLLSSGLWLGASATFSRAADLSAPPIRLGGWREAVVIVADLAPWIETLTTVGGWEVADRRPRDSSLNAFWALSASARCEQVLMRNIGTETGFLRLVRVQGLEQRRMRSDDQAWDSGGIQALDLRVADMEATRTALHARGWRAPSDPIRYKTFGVEVIEWAPSSPDGVRFSFIQRVSPPLTGWDELKRWSRTANAAITVRDMPKAKAAFGDVLGLRMVWSTNTVGADGPNVMGLPWDFARKTPVDIEGYGSGEGVDGSVELISMPQVQGRNFAADTHPPNLGIAALRFQVGDVSAMERAFSPRGADIVSPVQPLDIGPYGRCAACAIEASDGVRLELFSPSSTGRVHAGP